jgi:hypothetical protein
VRIRHIDSVHLRNPVCIIRTDHDAKLQWTDMPRGLTCVMFYGLQTRKDSIRYLRPDLGSSDIVKGGQGV